MSEIGSYKTELNDRTLYGDGSTVAGLPFLYKHILEGRPASQVHVSEEDFNSDEVTEYNKKFLNDRISCRTGSKEISLEWYYPEEYGKIDLREYILDKFKTEIKEAELDDDEVKHRFYRIKMELRLWEERGLNPMLRTLIYVINTFEDNDVIWGVGRGSSCASYILYLIGIHQVDSVLFNIDIGEFFR